LLPLANQLIKLDLKFLEGLGVNPFGELPNGLTLNVLF